MGRLDLPDVYRDEDYWPKEDFDRPSRDRDAEETRSESRASRTSQTALTSAGSHRDRAEWVS